jgi:hypothetical protein
VYLQGDGQTTEFTLTLNEAIPDYFYPKPIVYINDKITFDYTISYGEDKIIFNKPLLAGSTATISVSQSGMILCFNAPQSNTSNTKLYTNNIEKPLKDEYGVALANGVIKGNEVCYIQYREDVSYINGSIQKTYKRYVYLGGKQIYSRVSQTDDTKNFSVNKIGYITESLSGGEYEQIYSNQLALERAKYELWLRTQFKDTISLEMLFVPFLEANQIIEYNKPEKGISGQYMIKSISVSNFTSGTMTITAIRYYPSTNTKQLKFTLMDFDDFAEANYYIKDIYMLSCYDSQSLYPSNMKPVDIYEGNNTTKAIRPSYNASEIVIQKVDSYRFNLVSFDYSNLLWGQIGTLPCTVTGQFNNGQTLTQEFIVTDSNLFTHLTLNWNDLKRVVIQFGSPGTSLGSQFLFTAIDNVLLSSYE